MIIRDRKHGLVSADNHGVDIWRYKWGGQDWEKIRRCGHFKLYRNRIERTLTFNSSLTHFEHNSKLLHPIPFFLPTIIPTNYSRLNNCHCCKANCVVISHSLYFDWCGWEGKVPCLLHCVAAHWNKYETCLKVACQARPVTHNTNIHVELG